MASSFKCIIFIQILKLLTMSSYDNWKQKTPDEDELENRCNFCDNPCEGSYCDNACKRAELED